MKRLKYFEDLEKVKNCPPCDYKESKIIVFRWVHCEFNENDFVPLNKIKNPPPRMLDDSELMCKGFGLSVFNSLENAFERYKKLYKTKRNVTDSDFISEKGDSVAELNISIADGIIGDLNEKGHLTFHIYENVNLSEKVLNIVNIFKNGNFTR